MTKKIAKLIAFGVLLGAAGFAFSQPVGVALMRVDVAPSGLCQLGDVPQWVKPTGVLWTCQGIAHGQGTWTALPTSGSGSGTVNTGTGIAYYPTSGAAAVSGTTTPIASFLDTGGAVFNVKAYGAKGDERTISDAVATASSPTVTSATAAFTLADTGKTFVVNAGAAGVLSVTYTSGGSITGSINQTCFATFTGGSGTATAVWKLTGSNVIAGSAAAVITAVGTGYSSGSQSATLSSGTATCSGTATVNVTSLYYAPLVTTATYVNSTTITMGTNATNSVSSAFAAIGTNDTAAINSAITAATAQTGGTIFFPPGSYTVAGQLPFATSGSYILSGSGATWDGTWGQNGTHPAGTSLDMLYALGPKITTPVATGVLRVSDLGFFDHGSDSQPFIDTSLFTLRVENNSFYGTGPGHAASISTALQMGVSHFFQGYGTVISKNFFANICNVINAKQYVNAIVVRDNTVSAQSGCKGGGGVFNFHPDSGHIAEGNVFAGNLLEMTYYDYAFTFSNSQQNIMMANTVWDIGALYLNTFTISNTSPGNVEYSTYGGANYATVDTASNQITAYNGQNINNLVYMGIGTSASNLYPLHIYGTTNKFRITNPSVADCDYSVDGSGVAQFSGCGTYNFANPVYATMFYSATGGIGLGITTPSGYQLNIHAPNGTSPSIRMTQAGVADVDTKLDGSGNYNWTGAALYTFGAPIKATGYQSSDGTAGFTGTCTTAIVVKNGLITGCS